MDSIRIEEWRTPAIALAAAVLGSLITLLGQHLTSSREYDAKMVEIAMGVLRAEPSKVNKDLLGVRAWAVKVIERHSGTRFGSDEERDAVKNNPVPYKPEFLPLPADKFLLWGVFDAQGQIAKPADGTCPSGWTSSGSYCVRSGSGR